ncbi:hypothetical protein [Citrobacter sp. Cpo102]|uniref:hypothetical protein n=1 Tax=Citrobacter sp. Cpo102 TaxID=2985142 RepID=UPI0025753D5C|nr:hypothetical protein [Citrobacter sp. Cpo102]MDM2817307.1 hypothetical protein [Citrobacter sp. Cpo102]
MLLNMLEKQAALQPNAIALQGDSRSWSWQQYHEAVIHYRSSHAETKTYPEGVLAFG